MNNIKKVREHFKLSQSELARLAGLTPATISMAEKPFRDISLSTAVSIASAIGVTVGVISGTEKIEDPDNKLLYHDVLTERLEATTLLGRVRQLLDKGVQF